MIQINAPNIHQPTKLLPLLLAMAPGISPSNSESNIIDEPDLNK